MNHWQGGNRLTPYQNAKHPEENGAKSDWFLNRKNWQMNCVDTSFALTSSLSWIKIYMQKFCARRVPSTCKATRNKTLQLLLINRYFNSIVSGKEFSICFWLHVYMCWALKFIEIDTPEQGAFFIQQICSFCSPKESKKANTRSVVNYFI